MKNQKLYSIYDRKAETHSAPFLSATDATASRSFSQAVLDPKTTINQHPADFELVSLAEWDDSTGQILQNNVKSVKQIITGTQIINSQAESAQHLHEV